MTPVEAVAMAERALRRGSCSAHKLATEGCATCEASEEAIRVLHAMEEVVASASDVYDGKYATCPEDAAERTADAIEALRGPS